MPGRGPSGDDRDHVRSNGAERPRNDVVVRRPSHRRRLGYLPGRRRWTGPTSADIDGDSPLSHGVVGFGIDHRTISTRRLGHDPYVDDAAERVLDRRQPAEPGSVAARTTSRSRNAPRPARCAAAANGSRRSSASPRPTPSACVDLPPGALAAKGTRVGEPIRVFAFDQPLPRSLPVDPDRLGSARELGSRSAQRRGGSPARRRARTRRSSCAVPGRAVVAATPGDGHRRSGPGAAALLEPQGEQARGIPYVPNVVVFFSGDVPRVVVPAFDRGRATRRHLHEEALPVLDPTCSSIDDRLEADPATALAPDRAVTRGDRPRSAPVRGT